MPARALRDLAEDRAVRQDQPLAGPDDAAAARAGHPRRGIGADRRQRPGCASVYQAARDRETRHRLSPRLALAAEDRPSNVAQAASSSGGGAFGGFWLLAWLMAALTPPVLRNLGAAASSACCSAGAELAAGVVVIRSWQPLTQRSHSAADPQREHQPRAPRRPGRPPSRQSSERASPARARPRRARPPRRRISSPDASGRRRRTAGAESEACVPIPD